MYSNWDEQALNSLVTIKWYSVTELIAYLDNLRRYIIMTPGKLCQSYMPTILYSPNESEIQSLPARKDQRFPINKAYVCEAIGDWGLKLDILALISSVMINSNRLERKYPTINFPGDVEHCALEMIHELLRMAQNRTDFVNRQQFEARYGLDWTNDHAYTRTQENTMPLGNHSVVKKEDESFTRGDSEQQAVEQPASINTPLANNEREFRSATSESSDPTIDLTLDN